MEDGIVILLSFDVEHRYLVISWGATLSLGGIEGKRRQLGIANMYIVRNIENNRDASTLLSDSSLLRVLRSNGLVSSGVLLSLGACQARCQFTQ